MDSLLKHFKLRKNAPMARQNFLRENHRLVKPSTILLLACRNSRNIVTTKANRITRLEIVQFLPWKIETLRPNCTVRKLWLLIKLWKLYANTTIRKLLFSFQKVKSITLPLIQDKEESVGGTIKWATMQMNAFAHVIISVENAAISVILNNAARLNRTRPIF